MDSMKMLAPTCNFAAVRAHDYIIGTCAGNAFLERDCRANSCFELLMQSSLYKNASHVIALVDLAPRVVVCADNNSSPIQLGGKSYRKEKRQP